MRSSRKLKFERCKHFHSKKQPLITLDLKYFMIQTKLRYLKSILQSRPSLLPSYCISYWYCIDIESILYRYSTRYIGRKEARKEGRNEGRKEGRKGGCMHAAVCVTVKRSTQLLACWACCLTLCFFYVSRGCYLRKDHLYVVLMDYHRICSFFHLDFLSCLFPHCSFYHSQFCSFVHLPSLWPQKSRDSSRSSYALHWCRWLAFQALCVVDADADEENGCDDVAEAADDIAGRLVFRVHHCHHPHRQL